MLTQPRLVRAGAALDGAAECAMKEIKETGSPCWDTVPRNLLAPMNAVWFMPAGKSDLVRAADFVIELPPRAAGARNKRQARR